MATDRKLPRWPPDTNSLQYVDCQTPHKEPRVRAAGGGQRAAADLALRCRDVHRDDQLRRRDVARRLSEGAVFSNAIDTVCFTQDVVTHVAQQRADDRGGAAVLGRVREHVLATDLGEKGC